jgi:predicted DNA-binding protein (UPF0251 family)
VPDINYYKPKGIPSSFLEEILLTLDEFEAIRLADLEGLYQEQAANKMDISRQTFGRIIDSAHRKIADTLIHGKALKIEGGEVAIGNMKRFKCKMCNNCFDYSLDTRKKVECPHCKKINSVCKTLPQGGKA